MASARNQGKQNDLHRRESLERKWLSRFKEMAFDVFLDFNANQLFLTEIERDWIKKNGETTLLFLEVEDIVLRGKNFGMSYIYTTCKQLLKWLETQRGFVEAKKIALELIEEIKKQGFDNLDVRFGNEVVLSKGEFLL